MFNKFRFRLILFFNYKFSPFGRICNPAALNRGICNPSPFALSDISITVLFDFILFRVKDNDKLFEPQNNTIFFH